METEGAAVVSEEVTEGSVSFLHPVNSDTVIDAVGRQAAILFLFTMIIYMCIFEALCLKKR